MHNYKILHSRFNSSKPWLRTFLLCFDCLYGADVICDLCKVKLCLACMNLRHVSFWHNKTGTPLTTQKYLLLSVKRSLPNTDLQAKCHVTAYSFCFHSHYSKCVQQWCLRSLPHKIPTPICKTILTEPGFASKMSCIFFLFSFIAISNKSHYSKCVQQWCLLQEKLNDLGAVQRAPL